MKNSPDKPPDDGKISMPRIDNGMNRVGPVKNKKRKRKVKDPRPANAPPAYSETNEPEYEDGDSPEDKTEAKDITSVSQKPDNTPDEDESDADILTRIRKRFDRCVAWEAENRKEAVSDRKFKKGDQYSADVAAQRNADKRPCEVVNKIPVFVRQVTNDQRQNRPAINISPVGDKGDPEGAKMFRGMIRAIERDSKADIAYDTAFDDAVTSGFGYFRLLTEFEAPDSFNQIIVVKRIRNPFTVYLDPDHQEPDGSDCRFGFVTEIIPRDEFKEEWPDADIMPFDQQSVGEGYKDWSSKDSVRIAEYFEIKNRKRKLVELENGWTGFEDELDDDVAEKIASKRMLVEQERETHTPTIHWYKVTAKEILERNIWLGQWIPIIPVIGNEIDIEGKVTLSGIIRDAKGAQRIYNYAVNAEIETVGLAPKAPWIVEEGQIEGHEDEWKQANIVNFPYLSYKGTSVAGRPAPAPQRQAMVGSPAGFVNLKLQASQDLMATTGIRFDPTNSEKRVDDSGRAIREMRRSSDLGSSHYVDNLGRSLHFLGAQFIDLIPKIYDKKQVMTILREDDTEEQIQIDPHAPQAYKEVQQETKKLKIFNPKFGKYGVTVTIGPSYATKRIEAAESMMAFAKAMPNTAQLVADLIAKYQDWPGAEEMAARLAKAVPPQLLTPDQKDIPPQIQAVMQHMEAQIKQLTQQLQGAMAALNDKDKDRAVALEKIQKDFEAKMFGVVQKAEGDFQKHIGFHVQNLARDVKDLTASLEQANKPKPDKSGNQSGGDTE